MTACTFEPASSDTDHNIAKLAAIAMVIHTLEAGLPSPIPGIKLGLANIIILYCLAVYGWRAAAWVSILRVVGSGIVLGQLFAPGFFLSLSGATASLMIMLPLHWLLPRWISLVGVAVAAAAAHIMGQFFIAWIWLIPHPAIWHMLPLFLIAALVSGLVGGTMAQNMYQRHPSPHP